MREFLPGTLHAGSRYPQEGSCTALRMAQVRPSPSNVSDSLRRIFGRLWGVPHPKRKSAASRARIVDDIVDLDRVLNLRESIPKSSYLTPRTDRRFVPARRNPPTGKDPCQRAEAGKSSKTCTSPRCDCLVCASCASGQVAV